MDKTVGGHVGNYTAILYYIGRKKSGKEELLNYIEAINASVAKDTAK